MMARLIMLGLVLPLPALADGLAENENTCDVDGQGDACINDSSCSGNAYATKCVSAVCQIPCIELNDAGQPVLDVQTNLPTRDPSHCGGGETCVAGGSTYYCQASAFRMDLNILDSCIQHFLEGLTPVFDLSASTSCRLQSNLNRFLDQDGDGNFDIFDVDLCIRSFLSHTPCDAATQSCDNGQVYCEDDAGCGKSLYCNTTLHQCERECGLVARRHDDPLATSDTLDRQCTGALKVCNVDRGRCEAVDLAGSTCQVDTSCPPGAVCFLGECVPKCYRSIDCPGSNWYCSSTNRCVPKPPDDPGQDAFDPKQHSVRFAQKAVTIDAYNNSFDIPLLIMNTLTKKQVFDNKAAVFGYRAEIKYGLKQSPACQDLKADTPQETIADCIISEEDGEGWLTLLQPFGTIFASTTPPTFDILLNENAADKLSTGLYNATVTIIFDNGNVDSTTVTFSKPTKSGNYSGRLTVYGDVPANRIGNQQLSMQLYIDEEATKLTWQDLLEQNNLTGDQDITVLTSGYPVTGTIDGNQAMIFNAPGATSTATNKVPIVGIYSPDLGRMQLVTVIEIDARHCQSENGACSFDVSNAPLNGELQIPNVFRRKIRRYIEWIGPYDPTTRRFTGLYRESISGLLPDDITLEGGFILQQAQADDTAIEVDPLLAAPSAVGFMSAYAAGPYAAQASTCAIPADPNNAGQAATFRSCVQNALLAEVAGDVAAFCTAAIDPGSAARSKFEDNVSFATYLDQFDGGGKVFTNLVNFEEEISDALGLIGTANSEQITVHDFLKGEITFCNPPAVVDNCIDEDAVRCGLALHQKALLSRWYDTTEFLDGNGTRTHDLFCSQSSPSVDCQTAAADSPALKLFQEHNRFYKELTYTLKFRAGNSLSDAFLKLYRAGNDALDLGVAIGQKRDAVRAAWDDYNAIRDEIFSPVGTQVLFDWPMEQFASRGYFWIKELHAVMTDRMETLNELVDIKRRLLASSNSQDFIFLHHMMQQEYLTQVFLFALQKQWESVEFGYQGQGEEMFELGQQLVSRVNETRNPLGLHPDRVYFENKALEKTNWQNYRDRLNEDLINGAINGIKGKITTAIDNMRQNRMTQNNLVAQLQAAQLQTQAEIDAICGIDPAADEAAGDSECDLLDAAEQEVAASCQGPDCLYEYECTGDACNKVRRVFADGSKNADSISCQPIDGHYYLEKLNRPCTRGQMGSMLHEKVQLEFQREQVLTKVNNLLRQMASEQTVLAEMQKDNAALLAAMNTQSNEIVRIQSMLRDAAQTRDLVGRLFEAAGCSLIIGMSNGGDCIQKAIALGAYEGAAVIFNDLEERYQNELTRQQFDYDRFVTETNQNAAVRQQVRAINNLSTEVGNLVAEYTLISRQLGSLAMRINDTFFIAKRAERRSQRQQSTLIEHIIGGAEGTTVMRNSYALDVNRQFQDILIYTYKMAQAFIHNFNLRDEADAILADVYKLVTVRDVENFIAKLNAYDTNECGAGGFDCDAANNYFHYKFSVRDELFPHLRDVVDGRTGRVLTKGEQFHNIITSSQYIKRVRRNGVAGLVEQIEIPFSIWLNDRSGTAALVPYMISPLQCNHYLVGKQGQGTMGINVKGDRLESLTVETVRGNTDYVGSCTSVNQAPPGGGTPQEVWPVHEYTIGYPPVNAWASQDSPPEFSTKTSWPVPASCYNKGQSAMTDGSNTCYTLFARDRSLAAPDYKLVIPLGTVYNPSNNWVVGVTDQGVPKTDPALIRDLEIYFRYRKRDR